MTDETSERPVAKPPPDPAAMLTTSILLFAFLNLGYGVAIAGWPGVVFGTVGGADPAALPALESMRWAGAVLVAWGTVALAALRQPRGQATLVTGMALQPTLGGLALVVTAAAGEHPFAEWFVWVNAVVLLAAAAFIWLGRIDGRGILRGRGE